MTGTELLNMADELDEYYCEFDGCCPRSEGRAMLRRYARGQLGPLERKSLQPIADAEGIDPRTLQFFFINNGFDEDAALDLHQQRVTREIGGPDGIFVIDETSDAKKGECTAGIDKQYCGESGKLDNCIVSVHTAYVRDDVHCLLDGELFLPESWNPDASDPKITRKRARAKIPADAAHETKTVMALRQLKRARENGVPGRYVTADALYGGAPWWRQAVADLGLIYAVEVPSNVYGWIGARDGKAKSLAHWAATHRSLRCGPKKQVRTHETEKGPEVWEVRRATFVEQAEAAPKGAQTLLVAWNVRTKERKFFLANAPRGMKTEALLKVAFSRWRVERCFEDAKGEVGLNHAELRTYRGLRRHFLLTAINHYFLVTRVRRRGEKGSDVAAGGRRAAGDSGTTKRGDHDARASGAAGRTIGGGGDAHAGAQPQGANIRAQAPAANAA
jgi:SRSO17 transposase